MLMRILATVPVLLLALLSGCGDSDSNNSEKVDKDSTPSSSAPSTADPSGPSGTPKTDPCDLLTKASAEAALGVPVGTPKKQPGEGNLTCYYTPADGTANVFALLTTYSASGEAALKTASAEFPDARPVPELGDAAIVSRQGHVIGVSVDDVLFALSVLRADAFTVDPAVSEAQLITLAHTVVDSR